MLGAPERFDLGALGDDAKRHTATGRRVLALTRGRVPEADPQGDEAPPGLQPLGLVVLGERLRPETRLMIAYLLREGVEVKVLSGDAQATVAAIARDSGIPLGGGALAGSELPDDPEALRETARATAVVGRVSPENKRRFVEALQASGRYVAMVGDGVNDVPALNAARLGIAQGSGAQMARSVADVVLVEDRFAVVPPMVEQGRQALRNLQRVAKLYVTKSAFAAFLIVLVGTTSTAYPLLPRHFSIAAGLTIGIPTFFLALAPSSGPWRSPNFTRDVASFAVPAGTLIDVGVLASYLFSVDVLELPLVEARTVALTVLVVLGLYLILVLEAVELRRPDRRLARGRRSRAFYLVVLVAAPLRDFFDVATPDLGLATTAAAGGALSLFALFVSGFTPGARLPCRHRKRPLCRANTADRAARTRPRRAR